MQVLAELEAVPYKTMYNRIMAHQVKDGVTYLTPENTKGMKKAKAISETKQKQAKEKEKAAGLPEDPGKLPEKKKNVPDPGPAASINGVNLCKSCKMCQKGHAPFCKKFRHKLDGIVDYCSGYVSGVPEDVPKLPEVYEVEDETIEELNQLYFQCKQLAEKYQKQAEDWRRIMETCASWSNAKGRKLPEVQ